MTFDSTPTTAPFDPAALVATLDALGLRLSCRHLDNGTLALAPWNGAGGPDAERILTEACQSSANRVKLLAFLEGAGRLVDGT
jgi:hypothetical protein